MMLTADGGPQLLLQLEKGDPYAFNPSAQQKAFRRNKGYGDTLGDQDFSQDIVVPPGKLSNFDIPTFDNKHKGF